MKCSKCGSPLLPGIDSCRICGSKIESDIEIIDFENVKVEVGTKVDNQATATIRVEEIKINSNAMNDEEIDKIVAPVDEEMEDVLEELTNEKKANIKLFPIIILVLLLLSIGLNIYLYVNNDKVNNDKNDKKEVITKDILYNSYTLTVPNNWKYQVDSTNNLLLVYDSSEDFGISVQITEEANYNLLINDAEEFAPYLNDYNLEFTSNYKKTVNGKEMYLYKGKYNEYNTYLIFTRIDEKIMGITKLMFQSEVDDMLLNDVLEMNSSITNFKSTKMIDSSFNFTDLSKPIITKSTELKQKAELEESAE